MARWDPWLHADRAPVDISITALGDRRGQWARGFVRDEILLDSTLDRRTRREVLAHELVHAERRVGWPDATAATMQLEEERVWRTALDRLAPAGDVERFLARRSSVGPVSVEDLAEEFDLSMEAAQRVASLHRARGGAPSADDDA